MDSGLKYRQNLVSVTFDQPDLIFTHCKYINLSFLCFSFPWTDKKRCTSGVLYSKKKSQTNNEVCLDRVVIRGSPTGQKSILFFYDLYTLSRYYNTHDPNPSLLEQLIYYSLFFWHYTYSVNLILINKAVVIKSHTLIYWLCYFSCLLTQTFDFRQAYWLLFVSNLLSWWYFMRWWRLFVGSRESIFWCFSPPNKRSTVSCQLKYLRFALLK